MINSSFPIIAHYLLIFLFFCRLKYLLSQSDIFSHFGATKGYKNSNADTDSGRKAAGGEDMDEDEHAMAGEIGEGDEEGTTSSPHFVALTKQPSIITGGTLRYHTSSVT